MSFVLNTNQGAARAVFDAAPRVSKNAPILGIWKGHATLTDTGNPGLELTLTIFETGGKLAATIRDSSSPATDLMVNVAFNDGVLTYIQGTTPQKCPNRIRLTLDPDHGILTGESYPATDPFSLGCNKTYKPDANYSQHFERH
jgi:hypothetical protein